MLKVGLFEIIFVSFKVFSFISLAKAALKILQLSSGENCRFYYFLPSSSILCSESKNKLYEEQSFLLTNVGYLGNIIVSCCLNARWGFHLYDFL